jgi:hypothetical protein
MYLPTGVRPFYVNSLKIDYDNAQVDAVLTDSAPSDSSH